MLKSQLGINKSSSTSFFIPKPRQSGQAPSGLLNENNLGSSLGTLKPHSGQAKCSENKASLPSLKLATTTSPPVSFKPTSSESIKRLR